MTSKLFEIRDRMTFIPALASQIGKGPEQSYLLARVGITPRLTLLTKLSDCTCKLMPEEWGVNPRTMYLAHMFIQNHFSSLADGDVIDVEWINNETRIPKRSECYSNARPGADKFETELHNEVEFCRVRPSESGIKYVTVFTKSGPMFIARLDGRSVEFEWGTRGYEPHRVLKSPFLTDFTKLPHIIQLIYYRTAKFWLDVPDYKEIPNAFLRRRSRP